MPTPCYCTGGYNNLHPFIIRTCIFVMVVGRVSPTRTASAHLIVPLFYKAFPSSLEATFYSPHVVIASYLRLLSQDFIKPTAIHRRPGKASHCLRRDDPMVGFHGSQPPTPTFRPNSLLLRREMFTRFLSRPSSKGISGSHRIAFFTSLVPIFMCYPSSMAF